MSDPRFAGHCFVCGCETHEIKRVHPQEHPLAGEPSQIGRPMAEATRCELLLVSGRRMPVTVHADCVAALEADLPKHWKTIMGAFRHEEVTRQHRKVKQRTPRQQLTCDAFMDGLVVDVPLGVLNAESWREIVR